MKIYRDNVWGDIELDDLAVKIIDTPEFQRLDGIKQLGFADYVYRGAKHTRFSHSIGVYHVSKKIVYEIFRNHKRLNIPLPPLPFGKEDKMDKESKEVIMKVVSIAGLLHDITHIPYGHSLEDEISLYGKHDSIDSLRLWDLLFDERSAINSIFTKKEPWIPPLSNIELLRLIFVILKYKYTVTSEKIKDFNKEIDVTIDGVDKEKDERAEKRLEMLKCLKEWYENFLNTKRFHPFMSDIFGNTICADLLDYLRRDSLGTGLKMEYDDKIFKFFFIARNKSNTNELRAALSVFDKRGDERFDVLSEILEIMRMRHALAERVYYHKTKASATSMLISLLMRMKDLPKDSNPYDDTDNSILNFTEAKLFEFLNLNCQNEEDKKLLKMILNRNLFKIAAVIPFRLAYSKHRLDVDSLFVQPYHNDPTHKKRKELEKKIKIRNEVLVYCPPQHPQSKEIQTFIQSRELISASPLNRLHEELTMGQEVQLLSKDKYIHLWKFFLFLHPEDADNEIIVSKVITKFCSSILPDGSGSAFLNDKEFVRHQNYKPLHELRKTLLIEWKTRRDDEFYKETSKNLSSFLPKEICSFVYPKILQRMLEIVSIDMEWKKYISDKFIEKDEYFIAFDMLWWTLLIEKPLKVRPLGTGDQEKLKGIAASPEKIRELQHEFINVAAAKVGARGDTENSDWIRYAEKFVIDNILNK